MMSMIHASTASTTTVAKRLISSSARASNAAVSISHTAVTSAAAPSNGAKTAKTVAYTILGSTAVAAGVSRLFKDEVVYWTPNK